MEFANNFIFFGGLLLGLSIFAGTLSSRIGAPLLLVYLLIGVLFGEDGPGGIVYNDMQLSYTICSLALALILFDGGVRTSIHRFRMVWRPALSLATIGVVITAAVTGFCLHYFLSMSLAESLLIGATVASTDAAAVFLLLHQRNILLDRRVTSTLEVESGFNDPTAVLLTLACVHILLADSSAHWLELVGTFFKQMGIGVAVGYTGGIGLARIMNKLELVSGVYPIFAVAGALLIFGGTNLLDGSGFMAVYLAGLMLGNSKIQFKGTVQQFVDGMAWLSQMTMLLILGLLVTPTKLLEDLPLSLTVASVLILLARPAAVVVSLLFSRYHWREVAFISWVGLRGAIPIYLAIIPSLLGVPNGYHYFNVAFTVVIISLVLQGWTVGIAAKVLKVTLQLPVSESDKDHPS